MGCRTKVELMKDLRAAKVPRSDMKLANSILDKLVKMEVPKMPEEIKSNYDGSYYSRLAEEDRRELDMTGKVEKVPERMEGYYDSLQKLVEEVIKPEVTSNVFIAFSKATLREMNIVAGRFANNKIMMAHADKKIAEEAAERLIKEYLGEQKYMNEVDPEEFAKKVEADEGIKAAMKAGKEDVAGELMARYLETKGSHAMAHEFVHAGAANFMKNNPEHKYTKRVKALYEEAMENIEDIKHSMIYQGMSVNTDGMYWTKNVDEFLAEGLTNPKFMAVLSTARTQYKGNRLAPKFAQLIDTALKMLGIEKDDSRYEALLDSYLAIVEAQREKGSDSIETVKRQLDSEFSKVPEDIKSRYDGSQKDIQDNRRTVDDVQKDNQIVFGGLREITLDNGEKFKTIKVEDATMFNDTKLDVILKTTEGYPKKIRVDVRTKKTTDGQYAVKMEGEAVLGSKDDIKTKYNKSQKDKFKQLEEDIHGNPEKMVELLGTLDDLEGNIVDREHKEYLEGLIGSMDPKFFTSMKTYVNDKAKETGGIVDGDAIYIDINPNARPNKGYQTAVEAYAHEVVHAYTRFAVKMARDGDQKAREVLRQLEATMLRAKEDTKWEDLLDGKVEDATELEVKEAKAMYEYMFDSEYAEDEFMAHVLTNPMVMKKMKRVKLHENKADTVWGKIKEMFESLVGYLLGEYKFKNRTKSVYAITTELAMKFAEMNNEATAEARKMYDPINRLTDAINDLDEDASNLLRKGIEKISPSDELLGEKPESAAGRAAWSAKALSKMVFHSEYRKLLLTYLDNLGWLKANGTIASIINDMVEQDATQKAVDWLLVKSDKLDQNRMNMITTTKGLVRDGFKEKLTKAEEELITEVLIDTDVQSIMKRYPIKDVRRMLEDQDVLEKKLGNAKHRLKKLDEKNYNWHVNQASGLGYYMTTGKAHIRQNMNSKSIALGVLSEQRKKPFVNEKGDVEALIDEVATLTALKYVGKNEKKKMAELAMKDPEGMKNVLRQAKMLQEEARKTIFEGEETFMIKGYTKELFDDRMDIEVAPLSKQKEMEERGYELVTELDNHSLVKDVEKYGMYKTASFGVQGWERAATRLTKQHRKGTSLKDIYYNEDDPLAKKKHLINVKEINIEGMKLVKKMNEGELDVETLEYGLSPIVDPYGSITSYRYMMPKKAKKDILKQNTAVSEVLGATRGTMVDKMESIDHNNELMKMLKEDNAENYVPGQTIGKNGRSYVLVTDKSDDPDIQDLWNILPKTFKEEALRNEEGGFPIRKDLINNVFGYRHMSFANFPGLEKIMPRVLKNAIQIAEAIWMEFIKIVKVDILLKMPFVLVGNIVSNMVYAINTGSNPIELMGMYKESVRDVRGFLKVHKEWLKLKELEALGKLTKNEGKKIALLEKQMKNNPIHELYDRGMYQAIVEDATQEELSDTNKLKKWYNEKTERVPKVVKDGMNWLYLTEETQYYKFMTEVLQISDLVARDVERKKLDRVNRLQANGKKDLPVWYIQHLKESDDEMASLMRIKYDVDNRKRKMSGEEKKYFMEKAEEYKWNYMLHAFVLYNKKSGPAEEYLNKMGFVMFTKYAKRIQRVLAETGVKHPLKSMLVLMGDNLVWDVDTIQDQSLFTRSWYNMQPQWPWQRVLDVMTPAMLQESTYRIF